MKASAKPLLIVTLISMLPGLALAQNVPLTCWYDDHADFTSAGPAAGGATVGSVAKAGRGDKTYSYTILARDGAACPVQLPLSTASAVTVALVRQNEGSCSNDNVSDAPPAAVGGSVTVSPETSTSTSAGIKLAGLSPNTNYVIFLKCVRRLGTLRTDAEGNGGRTVSFATDLAGPTYAFELAPEGEGAGAKLQSLTLKK